MSSNVSTQVILESEQRIRPYVRETLLEPSLSLSVSERQVFLKLENLQHTGSFKLRGAMNKLLSLNASERAKGIVTASTGNHGAAVAYGLKALGIKGLVCVPTNASPAKVANIQRLGAEIRQYGDDGVITETYARDLAKQNDMVYLSPYNDPMVIAGQGSIGVELIRQLENIDTIMIALGGGGLLSGIGLYLKSVMPHIKVMACSPENSAVMMHSIKAGRILDLPSESTLSDGTAGGVEEGSITFELCQKLIDGYVTVTEGEIKLSLRRFLETQHMLIEGAAAMVLASYEKIKTTLKGNTVLVMCGANISLENLKTALSD
jgi:threonine dehydratase